MRAHTRSHIQTSVPMVLVHAHNSAVYNYIMLAMPRDPVIWPEVLAERSVNGIDLAWVIYPFHRRRRPVRFYITYRYTSRLAKPDYYYYLPYDLNHVSVAFFIYFLFCCC